MKLYCLTSFYDEPDLARAIGDAIDCGCTHVILLDGAYKHYPHRTPTSPPEQALAVQELCMARDIPCVVEALPGVTEARKRTRLFELAYENGATSMDWLFIQDGDQTITNRQDIKPILWEAKRDVFDTMGLEYDMGRFDDHSRRRWVRQTFRAIPGLHVDPDCHWRYLDSTGRVMWGYNSTPSAGDLPILIHNHSTGRGHKRAKGRDAYYDTRASQRVENDAPPEHCYHCDEPWRRDIATDIHYGYAADGGYGISHRRVLFVCDKHLRRVQYENTKTVEAALSRELIANPGMAAHWAQHYAQRKTLEQQAQVRLAAVA